MRPVALAYLETVLGTEHFDLDRVFGEPQSDGSRLYAFPQEAYEPRRIGWDCFGDLLETRGCEAERLTPGEDAWAMAHLCSRHASASLV